MNMAASLTEGKLQREFVWGIPGRRAFIFLRLGAQSKPPRGVQLAVGPGTASRARCPLAALCCDGSASALVFSAPQALAGPHFYTWGDHGGILMAIAQGGATAHLK